LPVLQPRLNSCASFRHSGLTQYVFPATGKTGHLVEVKGPWRRLCRKAGLSDVTIHDLRRTLGSRMAIAGVNLPTIGRVLGHLNLNATRIYARLDIEAARRALETNAKTLPLSLLTPKALMREQRDGLVCARLTKARCISGDALAASSLRLLC
jgi:integrase